MPVESAEDVYAWLVREDPEEPRRVFCRECVTSYIGDGEANPIPKEAVADTLVCQNCGTDLGNPDAPIDVGDSDG